jgi:CBS domain-containing protein
MGSGSDYAYKRTHDKRSRLLHAKGHSTRAAASLMKKYAIGAFPVAVLSDALLDEIGNDRDLCCGVLADAKNVDTTQLSELMTPVPVTCELEDSIEDCEELMQKPDS